MGILQAPQVLPGQVGVIGAIKYMVTTNSAAEIQVAGYLNSIDLAVNPILASDILGVTYSYNQNTGHGSFSLFSVSISNGVITLTQIATSGVTLPTIANHIATYTNTSGTLGEDAATAINGGNIQAGLSGTAGTLVSFPATGSKGSLKVVAVANTGDTITTISNAAMGQASVISIPDPAGATADFAIAPAALVNGNLIKASGTAGLIADAGIVAANVQTSSLSSPDAISDLIWYDVTATAAALATAGKVNIQVSSGAKQYKVRNVIVNYAAAGLSGGGGDRLLAISDGTTVYNNAGITAALLGTPINTLWGGTGNPVAGTVAQNTSTAAAANLFLQYAGGTTDYTTGQIVVSVLVQRVA